MREIKFRAWDDVRKKMYNEGWYDDLYLGDDIYDKYLMQYTGLKGKNGVEIYEGDIVRVLESGVHEKWASMSVVEFDNQYLGFSPFCYLNFVNENKSVEVIGNIYENPELLETK